MNINDTEISDEISRLVSLKGKDNWKDVRSFDKFKLVEKEYSFGVRKVFQVNEKALDYNNLQCSRNIGIGEEEDLSSILDKVERSINEISESNLVRIDELRKISNSSRSDFDFEKLKNTGFVELGFRIPYLMKFFKEEYGAKSWGYDVVNLSIQVAQKLGYDGRFYDFNDCKNEIDLKGAYLVVSYHMLEHISDPLNALKKIYDEMDSGTYFHVEIPVEVGVPRIEFAHLFPFHDFDLKAMLEEAGFNLISFSDQTHTGGSKIERYLVKK